MEVRDRRKSNTNAVAEGSLGTQSWVILVRLGKVQEDPWIYQGMMNLAKF